MEKEPVRQVKEKKGGWLRRMPLWGKVLMGFAALFAILFVKGLITATSLGGFKGRAILAERMMAPAAAPSYGVEMAKAAPTEAGAPAAREMWGHGGAADENLQVTASAPGLSLETWGRQLILNATLGLEVRDVRAAYDSIQSVAAAEGALITSANLQSSSSESGYSHAILVLRMPQSRFYALRQRLLRLAGDLKGKVLRDEVSSEDVTEQYVDLKARLRHWKSQEAQLLGIMSQARKISDILAVRDQLSAVQQEIERISGQLRFLESRVDLSTITVEVYQKGKGPVKPTIASVFKEAGKNISAAWMKAVQDVVGMVGWIVVAVTYLLPFAVIIAVAWGIVRAARRRALPRPPA